MSELTPTDEQAHIIELVRTKEPVAVTAGAGTGKTSTLLMLANDQKRNAWYVAYNRSIADSAARRFPGWVGCTTTHARAMRATGRQYAHRLKQPRQTSRDVAALLGIGGLDVAIGGVRKRVTPGKLAGLVMGGLRRFYNSADHTPGEQHVPQWASKYPADLAGEYRQINNRIREYLAPYLAVAWRDIQNPNGRLVFDHDAYLAMWVLSEPYLSDVAVIYADELQDSTARVVQLLRHQAAQGVQVVGVGDTRQSIYRWRSSVDGFEAFGFTHEASLTQSWRFGPEIADAANEILARLGDFRITGMASPGVVNRIPGEPFDATATLCRTNAGVAVRALAALDAGRRVCVIGGTGEIVSFANGAISLRDEGWTTHPDLQWASSWSEVVAYAKEDELGADLRVMVELIEEHTPEVIRDRLAGVHQNPEVAEVVFSTAHKAKGLEFERVALADDFGPEPVDEEARLLYVAVTRAMRALDVSQVPFYSDAVVAEADVDEAQVGTEVPEPEPAAPA